MNLRPYQLACRDAVEREWERVLRTLTVLPTGTGKTIIFSALASDIVSRGGRVLILAHREELIRQAADKLARSTGLACAIEKAEESAAGCLERIVVGSVQTLLSPDRRAALTAPTHIVVDEAHHVLSESYQSVLAQWPEAHVLGVTATPDRGDMRDLGTFFESLAYEYTLPQAIADGYLCRIKALTCPLKIDVSGVKVNGDYQAGSLGSALEPYLPQIATEIAAHGKDRKGIIFTPLCATAKTLQAHINAAGIRAYYADGDDRSQMAAFEADGPGSVMLNAMLLTEGYDHPQVDMIVPLRCTKVRSLYAQMVGRGTRIADGKDHLLLVDFLWMTERHSLCRPAHLVADDDDVARKMTEASERDAGAEQDIDEAALEAAKADVVRDREAALAKKLAEMRHRRRELVDPVQYAVSAGIPALVDYKPALASESAAPTAGQIEALTKCGIFPADIQHAGHATAILDAIGTRKAAGYATPKQVRCLERYGWTRAGQMTYVAAQKIITRIAANGWRLPHGMTPTEE